MMDKKYPCDTDKIRAVADRDSTLTTSAVRQAVKDRFGVTVSSSQVINAIDSFQKRISRSPDHYALLKEVAEKYLRTVGDRSLARQLISEVDL